VHRAVRAYVHGVDKVSLVTGKYIMFVVFGMMGILLYESISRTIFNRPHIWAVEFVQFIMAGYYTLGGAYSFLTEGQVRMDIFYHKWSPRRKSIVDAITFSVLLFYLVILMHGAIKGIAYAIEYDQVSYSAWSPVLYPIKIIMTIGIFMMVLQSFSEFFKDLARARGEDIPMGEEVALTWQPAVSKEEVANGTRKKKEAMGEVQT
jgi:TRAP-type mannitol/chloroaromatic compound transport system permease small subunit